jgi:hypothetical protein
MSFRTILVLLFVVSLATVAQAQTKISGTNHCAKPDPQTAVQVGDSANHSFSLGQNKCSWTKPWEIAGTPAKQGVATFSGEITGNTFRFHAYYVDEMANGDKAYYSYRGTATLKDGMAQTEQGTWNFLRGTGKLKGVKGKGTYKGKAGADGTMTYEVEGEYELPK